MTDMLKNWVNIFTEKELWNVLNRVRIVKIKPNLKELLIFENDDIALSETVESFANKYAGEIKIAMPVFGSDNEVHEQHIMKTILSNQGSVLQSKYWEICEDSSVLLRDSCLDVLDDKEAMKEASKLELVNTHFKNLDML